MTVSSMKLVVRGSCFRLRRWRRKGLGQPPLLRRNPEPVPFWPVKVAHQSRLRREGACRDGIQLALELLGRQGDRREVLELHTVSGVTAKSAADGGGSPAARRIVGKSLCEWAMLFLSVAGLPLPKLRTPSEHSIWHSEFGVRARTRVGPVLVAAKTEVQGKLLARRSIVILAEEVECALGSQELACRFLHCAECSERFQPRR